MKIAAVVSGSNTSSTFTGFPSLSFIQIGRFVPMLARLHMLASNNSIPRFTASSHCFANAFDLFLHAYAVHLATLALSQATDTFGIEPSDSMNAFLHPCLPAAVLVCFFRVFFVFLVPVGASCSFIVLSFPMSYSQLRCPW